MLSILTIRRDCGRKVHNRLYQFGVVEQGTRQALDEQMCSRRLADAEGSIEEEDHVAFRCLSRYRYDIRSPRRRGAESSTHSARHNPAARPRSYGVCVTHDTIAARLPLVARRVCERQRAEPRVSPGLYANLVGPARSGPCSSRPECRSLRGATECHRTSMCSRAKLDVVRSPPVRPSGARP